jgi:hypothetical protein
MDGSTKGNRIITKTVTNDDGGTEMSWLRASGALDATDDGSLRLHQDGSATYNCWTDADVPVVVHIAGHRVIVAADEEQPPAPDNVLLDSDSFALSQEANGITGGIRAAWGPGRDESLRVASDALGVICLDPAIRRWLRSCDPRALAQADAARGNVREALRPLGDGS